MDEMAGLLRQKCELFSSGVDHSSATLECTLETTYLADLAGTRVWQQRSRIQPVYTAVRLTDNGFDDMSSTAPPVGKGWEYCSSQWDRDDELASCRLYWPRRQPRPAWSRAATTWSSIPRICGSPSTNP